MIYHQVEHQSLTCKLMLQISKHVSVSKELNFFIYFPLKFTQTSKQREGIFPSQPENVFWHPSRFYWQMKWCWFHVTWRHMKPFVTQSFHSHLHIVGYFFLGEGTILRCHCGDVDVTRGLFSQIGLPEGFSLMRPSGYVRPQRVCSFSRFWSEIARA